MPGRREVAAYYGEHAVDEHPRLGHYEKRVVQTDTRLTFS